jgi:hypothetical protein
MANRLVEIHGLMGAIGEQLVLAYAAEQDVQRLVATARGRNADLQRLLQRASAENSAHFILGAAHSLANLVLRTLMLNTNSATWLKNEYREANGFRPGSDDRNAWLTLNKNTVKELRKAAKTSSNRFLVDAVEAVGGLYASKAFQALEVRRGMDYHRRRPQSVPHASPRNGSVSRASDGTGTISLAEARLEPESDADAVHALVAETLLALKEAMAKIRVLLPKAIRAEGIFYKI